MDKIECSIVNAAHIKVNTTSALLAEIKDQFSFQVPTAKYDKRFRQGLWDGNISLFNARTKILPYGLLSELKAYCDQCNYEFIDNVSKQTEHVTYNDIESFIKTLNIPKDIIPEVYDYQIQAIVDVINQQNRALVISPTSSGKSLIIYILFRWYDERFLGIFPTTTLVRQMAGDFKSYGYNEYIHQIMAGVDKNIKSKVVFSTWHSLTNVTSDWLNDFTTIIGDEAHQCTAKSLNTIFEKANKVYNRIGTTGTLDGTKVNELVIKGIFGPIIKTISTKEMIDSGRASQIKINAIEFTYSDDECKYIKSLNDYPSEITFIRNHEKRMNKMIKIISKAKGNKLILFKNIDHGKELYEKLKSINPNTFLVYGEVDTDLRDQYRALAEQSDDINIVASFKTFGTGISIKKIHHLFFTAAIKSTITVIQSIGRGLRLHSEKSHVTLWDFGDNFKIGKKFINFAYKHFLHRLEIYSKEGHTYKIYKVEV